MSIKYFSQYLIEKDIISKDQLIKAIDLQGKKNFSFGEFVLKTGFISKKDYEKILRHQLSKNITFFDAAIELKILNYETKEKLLSRQISNNIMLGEALVKENVLTDIEVDKYFKQFRSEQSVLELNILNAISSHEKSEIIDEVIQSTSNIFRYLLEIHPRIGGFFIDDNKPDSFDWVAYQEIIGDIHVVIELYLKEELIPAISTALLRQEVNEINELSLDSVAEFLNTLSGFICSSLSLKNIKCEPTIPEVLLPEEIDSSSKKIRLPFIFPDTDIEIRLKFIE